MSVHFPTVEELRQKMIDEFLGPNSKIDDLENDYITKQLIIGSSNATAEQVLASKLAYEASSLLTAIDDDLDAKCVERSATVRRHRAVKAIIKFELGKNVPATVDVPIAANSLITTESIGDAAALDYYVQNATVLPAGQKSVLIEAESSVFGQIGNINATTKVYPGMNGIDYVKFVEVITAGVDRESNDGLRERLLIEVQNMEKGGTELDYEIWSKRVPGVVTARSLSRARGNGTIDVVITGTNGLPTEQLIQDVQAYLETKKPAGGVSVLVKAPTPIYVNVTAQIKLEPDYKFEIVRPLVESALRGTIVAENKVLVVRASKLQDTIGDTKGVFSYKLTSPTGDIPLSGTDLAIPGTITITEVT
ncbi:baseplate J/gp47 family protein [Brevibacillus sp. AG]|uniref:baseplate J/gp47 family protein n=1 Tax=Brevibacillus sp. AG TaxID=3020891 RepID=UPI00232F1162|nr:baseplate J/gp47 family protein [Brevibacillus sp. AG]MDC0763490.1 baseplate J/gp47 family protein [Brevibacillus sp. AG]